MSYIDDVTKNYAISSRMSARTQSIEGVSIKAFDRFCRSKFDKVLHTVIEDLLVVDNEKRLKFLDSYVQWLIAENVRPSSIQTYFSNLKKYLRRNGIKLVKEDIRDFVQFPRSVIEMRYAISKEELKTILDNASERRKALYLTLVSSGMRIGETLALKKRDFTFANDYTKIVIPAKFTKTKTGRETFISSEAKELVERLCMRKTQDDYVFHESNNLHHALMVEEVIFNRTRKKANLAEKYSEHSRSKITLHSFRSFFFTKATNRHGDSYAHALTGHGGYLQQYYRLTQQERVKMYKELENDLLVYTNGNSAAKDDVIKDYGKRLSNAEKIIKELLDRLDSKDTDMSGPTVR